MEPKTIIGIDLGKLGGIAIFHAYSDHIAVRAMPLQEEDVDLFALTEILSGYIARNPHVVFEHITPLHLASAKSNWSLAEQGGMVKGICAALHIPYLDVLPKIWQKELFKTIPPIRDKKGAVDTKAQALIRVKQLYPELNLLATPRSYVPHSGIIDAVLIGNYAKHHLK